MSANEKKITSCFLSRDVHHFRLICPLKIGYFYVFNTKNSFLISIFFTWDKSYLFFNTFHYSIIDFKHNMTFKKIKILSQPSGNLHQKLWTKKLHLGFFWKKLLQSLIYCSRGKHRMEIYTEMKEESQTTTIQTFCTKKWENRL